MHRDGKSRVVVFTGGAVLEDDCRRFLERLEECAEVELAGVFCESPVRGLRGVMLDLWRRRRWLLPLLAVQRLVRRAAGLVTAPQEAISRRRVLQKLGGRIHFEPDLHAERVLAQVLELKPDIGAVYGGPILRPELFRIPVNGTLGIHHGLLPHYRGKKTTFWAMYNGEDHVGVAIQRIGTGLDRGDVLRAAVLPVRRMPLPVVRRRLERLGVALFVDAVLSVHRGEADFTPQPSASGKLYTDPRAGDVLRFWCRYLARLFTGGAVRQSGA